MNADSQAPRAGLRQLLLRSSAVELLGHGTTQLIRFGSNLLLARLLFPDAYGLAAIVNITNQGLIMLSDVGLPTAIVQSTRGDDRRFLNTAFTWQAVRGVLLWLLASALAWPLARFYAQPQLLWLVPVGALSVVILGFRGTAYFTMRRHLQLRPIMALEVLAQLAAVAVMVPWALRAPSVWTLIGGALASAFVLSAGSHFLRVGYRNRFEWDRQSAAELLHFGKWIAGSSVLSFASQQGDRLLLGRLLGTARLGVYSIAVFLSGAIGEATSRLAAGVLLPAFSRVRTDGPERLSQVFYRTRLAVDAVALPALGALTMLGPLVVELLYDTRYAEAGFMLQVLSVRVALTALVAPPQFCLIALGQTRYGFYLNLARTLALLALVPAGFLAAGVTGLLCGVAASELPALGVVYTGMQRAGLLRPRRELRVPVLFAAGIGAGYLLVRVLATLGLA